MMKLLRTLATLAALAGALAACDTPPVSPAGAVIPAIPPAHASPDPPPNRPLIVEDAGRSDAGVFDAGTGFASFDGGATDVDGGADAGAGPAATSGALSPAWQSAVSGGDAKVAALRPQFRACYTRSIKGRPQGRVMLHATVASDGTVQTVTASDNQGVTGRVVACMIDVLKAAQLPSPGRTFALEVPVSFPTP